MGLASDDVLAVSSFVEYPNVPAKIGMAISGNPALIGPLSTDLGLEDLEDILEVRRVDAHNRRVLDKARERK